VTDPIGALAHLQLGRAVALAGDTLKAKTAYQDFLTLWKDAHPDIPIREGSARRIRKLALTAVSTDAIVCGLRGTGVT
jgi:hypothetical protein